MNNLHLSIEAQSDLAEIKSYITQDLENPAAARSTVQKIMKDIRRLREYAFMGTPLASITGEESDYRFLVTGSYLTFYRVDSHNIFVDRVLYGRRDYLRILFENISGNETSE